jgi:lycopene cyclase domain-containing protein
MIENYFYLISLCIGIAGIAYIDYRYQLAFWFDARRTALTVLIGMCIFVVWDFVGIRLGIFFHGNSHYALPLRLLPEFPLEELFFLFLLCYVTLIIYRGVKKVWPRI